jgi:hypothetical protein
MIRKSTICNWFGHRDERVDDKNEDPTGAFPSYTVKCLRCESTHSVNSWASPRPTAKILYVWIVVLFLAILWFVKNLVDDSVWFKGIVSDRGSCCNVVTSNRLAHPYTYLMVDEWTKPEWIDNPEKTQRWLVSEGMVDGKSKFYRVLDTEHRSSN